MLDQNNTTNIHSRQYWFLKLLDNIQILFNIIAKFTVHNMSNWPDNNVLAWFLTGNLQHNGIEMIMMLYQWGRQTRQRLKKYVKLPRKCHNYEAQPGRGIEKRKNEGGGWVGGGGGGGGGGNDRTFCYTLNWWCTRTFLHMNQFYNHQLLVFISFAI